jgi:hypothetical protein
MRSSFIKENAVTRKNAIDFSLVYVHQFNVRWVSAYAACYNKLRCSFYIILRGTVSVLHKEALEDVDLGDEGQQREADRTTLGATIVSLG